MKRLQRRRGRGRWTSHPAGVRGLKRAVTAEGNHGVRSHPAGVRGLKQFHKPAVLPGALVAPRRGAWIETGQKGDSRYRATSHPAGVRGLKPIGLRVEAGTVTSHPAGVRGLKQHLQRRGRRAWRVAPRRGAWIETKQRTAHRKATRSHPAGVRGLKPQRAACIAGGLRRTPQGCVD